MEILLFGSSHRIHRTNSDVKLNQEAMTPLGVILVPSILLTWTGMGSPKYSLRGNTMGRGDTSHFIIYRWDGNAYQLIGEFYEKQLRAEIQVAERGRQDIVLRYNVGPHQLPTLWLDVLTLVGEQLVAVNDQYPDLYQRLLDQYMEMLPDYEVAANNGWPEALDELKDRMAAVKEFIGNNP